MPPRKLADDRVWACWVSSPPIDRGICDESGPRSWWWIKWQWNTLFGPEESEWHIIRVRRWHKLGVWVVYPEACDRWRLDPVTLDAKGELWAPIRYGNSKCVRKMPRASVAIVQPVAAINPANWTAGPPSTS